MNGQLWKSYVAGAVISAYTVVKFAGAGTVVPAAAATDSLVAVAGEISPALGERLDVCHSGITPALAGGAFAEGDPLTVDASGRVIKAVPAAGANVSLIGRAIESASAAGDVVRILISPSVMQG